MTPQRYRRLLEALQLRQPDLTVITDEVHKGRNLSAIVRTCDAVGIDTVHCVEPKAGYRGFRGTASGSHKWVQVEVHAVLAAPVALVKQRGMQIVAAAPGETSQCYWEIDYTQPTALLLGSEKEGLSELGLCAADYRVSVPMVGMVASLNVSVAAAIILQEAYRQRAAAKMYGSNQLPEAMRQKRFFQWAHPTVAAYCEQRGIAYPSVREEDGEIVDPAGWYREVQ